MAETILIRGERHVLKQCGTCAVWHTVPEIVHDSYYREGGFWHCPNGHQRGYRRGQEEIDRENIRLERDRLKQQQAQLMDEIAAQRTRAVAAEKKVLQTKRRANAGVCQCCNRTFSNVQRHMKIKHPNVVPLECASVKSSA
jgi:hypothetical protein